MTVVLISLLHMTDAALSHELEPPGQLHINRAFRSTDSTHPLRCAHQSSDAFSTNGVTRQLPLRCNAGVSHARTTLLSPWTPRQRKEAAGHARRNARGPQPQRNRILDRSTGEWRSREPNAMIYDYLTALDYTSFDRCSCRAASRCFVLVMKRPPSICKARRVIVRAMQVKLTNDHDSPQGRDLLTSRIGSLLSERTTNPQTFRPSAPGTSQRALSGRQFTFSSLLR